MFVGVERDFALARLAHEAPVDGQADDLHLANGIVTALGRVQIDAPIVIRIDGTNAEQGREILASANKLIGLPPDAVFIASDGSEYAAYRRFYQSAPVSLR